MKAFYLPLLATVALFAQCAKNSPQVAPNARVDYDQKSADIVRALSPSVPGTWQLRRVYIKAQSYNTGQKELGLVRDTVFQDFATLSLQPAVSCRPVPDPRYACFTGLLHFRTKTFPVRFEVTASPDRLFDDRGPQGTFFLEYNFSFPVGSSHPTEPEEQYLEYLGFINENFSLEVVSGQPTMTWRGLSRGLDRIELVK